MSDEAGCTFFESAVYESQDSARRLRERLTPYVRLEGEYDDNIFRTKKDPEYDLIWRVYPGIKYMFDPTREGDEKSTLLHGLVLDFRGEFRRYSKHKELNKNSSYLLLDFDAEAVFFERLTPYYRFRRNQRLASQFYSDSQGENRDRDIIYNTNAYGAGYKIGADRYYLTPSYDHQEVFYETEPDKQNNYIRNSGTLVGSVEVQPDTQAFISGAYGDVDRPKNSDLSSKFERVTVGLDGQLGPRTNGIISVGYLLWNNKNGHKTDTIDIDIDLTYQMHERLALLLMGRHTTQDSAEAAAEEDARVTQKVGIPEGVADVNAQYVKLTRGYLGFAYVPSLDDRITLRPGVQYERREYDTGRNDDIYEARVRLIYKLKDWLRIEGQYRHRTRMSDEESAEYRNNICTLRLTLEF